MSVSKVGLLKTLTRMILVHMETDYSSHQNKIRYTARQKAVY